MSKIHGRKACQIAGQFANPTTRNEWLRTTFRLMLKEVDNIDTSSRQKQMLMRDFLVATIVEQGLTRPLIGNRQAKSLPSPSSKRERTSSERPKKML
jgi:hypothetical protein